MRDVPTRNLLQLSETLAVISICHLSPETRRKLADDSLSVNAYPNDYGGFIYVGDPGYAVPTEPDLAAIFDVAARARIVWLKVDCDAAIVDGLRVYADLDEENAS